MWMRLDLEAFFEWLATCFSSDDVVGQPGRYFHSPLANFLSFQLGYVAGEDGRRFGRATVSESLWQELPRWAQVFALLSERVAFGAALSASDALEVLVQVEMMLAPALALVA